MATELGHREKRVLEHLGRYRISTIRILGENFFGGSEDGVKKALGRLKPYVGSAPLYGKTVYYRLTPAGAKLVGAPEEISRALGAQALPKAFGVLWFCCSGQSHRQRYLGAEFAQDLPELAAALAADDDPLDFYLDQGEDATVRLAHLVVDLGGDYQKLLQKLRGRVKQRLRTPALDELISGGLFTIAIVAATEEKRKAMEASLMDRPLAAWVRIEVCTELANLLVQGVSQ